MGNFTINQLKLLLNDLFLILLWGNVSLVCDGMRLSDTHKYGTELRGIILAANHGKNGQMSWFARHTPRLAVYEFTHMGPPGGESSKGPPSGGQVVTWVSYGHLSV